MHAGKSNSHIYKTFNPADFITSIINAESYSIAKDCRKQGYVIQNHEVNSLFIYLNKLMLIDTPVIPYNEYLLYVIKYLCHTACINYNPTIINMPIYHYRTC